MTPANQIQKLNSHLVGRLTEAMLDWYTSLGILDPRDYQADIDGFGYNPQIVPPYYRQNQKRGEAIPLYVNETQLRLYRDRSRKLCAESATAICGLTNRQNYVVGKGLQYRATAASPECEPALLAAVQSILDTFRELNVLSELELESKWRLDEDGDVFIRQFEADSGLLRLRFVEAEHVRSPVGDSYGPEHSFGIHTNPYDVEDIRGYWIVEAPLVNPMPTLVPASEVMHLKANTRRTAKRGLPLYYPVESNIRRIDDLLISMSSMAKTRAKFAVIRKFKDMAMSAAQNLVDGLVEVTATDPATGQTLKMERRRPGDIVNASDSIDYEFPNADIDESGLVGVLEVELADVARRLVMPAWMLTCRSDDANFATSLVAEAPSTKNFEQQQGYMARRFGELRYQGLESLAWRQIRVAVERGVLPATVYRLVKIQVEAPSLVVRDKAQEATVNETYMEGGIVSPQTVCSSQGWDFDQEQANRKQLGLPSLAELVRIRIRKTFSATDPRNPGNQAADPEPDAGEERPEGPGGPGRSG